jgi:hypothetical protein
MVEVVREEHAKEPRTLFVIGAYSIGKVLLQPQQHASAPVNPTVPCVTSYALVGFTGHVPSESHARAQERAFFGTARALGWKLWCEADKVKVCSCQPPSEKIFMSKLMQSVARVLLTPSYGHAH